MIQLLNMTHYEAMTKLIIAKKKHAGVDVTKIKVPAGSFSALVNFYLIEDNPNFRAYGYFNSDGELLSFINIHLSTRSNSWFLNKIVSSQDESGIPKNGIGELMSHCIQYAESRGMHKYYTIIPTKYVDSHEKIWAGLVPERERYDILFEDVIKANTRGRFDEYWNILMSTSLWPIDMVVRLHILRQEFRNTPL